MEVHCLLVLVTVMVLVEDLTGVWEWDLTSVRVKGEEEVPKAEVPKEAAPMEAVPKEEELTWMHDEPSSLAVTLSLGGLLWKARSPWASWCDQQWLLVAVAVVHHEEEERLWGYS